MYSIIFSNYKFIWSASHMRCRLVTIWILIRKFPFFPIVSFHLNGEIKHIMHVPMMILAIISYPDYHSRFSFNHGAQRK